MRAKAQALTAKVEFEKKREEFLRNGIPDAVQSFGRIRQRILDLASELRPDLPFDLKMEEVQESLEVYAARTAVTIEFRREYANSISNAKLHIDFWNGQGPMPGRSFFEAPKRISERSYTPDIFIDGSVGWISPSSKEPSTEGDVASYAVGTLFELIETRLGTKR